MFESAVSMIAHGIIVFNLSKMRGRETVCSRVPDLPGVYAWFQNYQPPAPETSSPDAFARYLYEQATRVHCLPRTGRIAPLYEVELRSRKEMTPGKVDSLAKLCESVDFRRSVATLLRSAMFFQQPLYVGKASHLPARIHQHLSASGELRRRLAGVGIDIDATWLVCMPIEGMDCLTDIPEPTIDESSGSSEAEEPAFSTEIVLEDLISKLFHPLFTGRYG
ncbi:MAG: hypothetical protein NTY19_28305 [Planctomycetota bacterium]|nr:hypothetical protein [Planctomycetota bacterium]